MFSDIFFQKQMLITIIFVASVAVVTFLVSKYVIKLPKKIGVLQLFALTFPIYYRHTIRCIKTDRKNIAVYDEVNPDKF